MRRPTGVAYSFSTRTRVPALVIIVRKVATPVTSIHRLFLSIWTRMNAKPLRAVNAWLRDYEAYWKETLRGLKKYLEADR